MSNIVVIVGRPNVGKSTLFNRLIQKKQAIVDNESGVTRDRHYARTDWNGVKFSLVDTGGYTQNSYDTFEKEIKRHVNSAIEESSLILFIVDVKSGITDLDFTLSKMLKKVSKKVLLVVNKVHDGLEILSVNIRDVFYENPGYIRNEGEVRTPNGTKSYGWGIRVLNLSKSGNLENISIRFQSISFL